jgi:hypothetical protein
MFRVLRSFAVCVLRPLVPYSFGNQTLVIFSTNFGRYSFLTMVDRPVLSLGLIDGSLGQVALCGILFYCSLVL